MIVPLLRFDVLAYIRFMTMTYLSSFWHKTARHMEWLSSPWASSVVGYVLGWWSTPSGRACACHCACDISGSADRELIGVLKGQLDRCAPDHLFGTRSQPDAS